MRLRSGFGKENLMLGKIAFKRRFLRLVISGFTTSGGVSKGQWTRLLPEKTSVIQPSE